MPNINLVLYICLPFLHVICELGLLSDNAAAWDSTDPPIDIIINGTKA